MTTPVFIAPIVAAVQSTMQKSRAYNDDSSTSSSLYSSTNNGMPTGAFQPSIARAPPPPHKAHQRQHSHASLLNEECYSNSFTNATMSSKSAENLLPSPLGFTPSNSNDSLIIHNYEEHNEQGPFEEVVIEEEPMKKPVHLFALYYANNTNKGIMSTSSRTSMSTTRTSMSTVGERDLLNNAPDLEYACPTCFVLMSPRTKRILSLLLAFVLCIVVLTSAVLGMMVGYIFYK